MLIDRRLESDLTAALGRFPAVTLFGPRQVGTTNLALLRALVDASRRPGRFLLLGSSSPNLVRGISESLAGRLKTLELQPFTLDEVGPSQENALRLWSRGGSPESFLAPSDRASRAASTFRHPPWRDTPTCSSVPSSCAGSNRCTRTSASAW